MKHNRYLTSKTTCQLRLLHVRFSICWFCSTYQTTGVSTYLKLSFQFLLVAHIVFVTFDFHFSTQVRCTFALCLHLSVHISIACLQCHNTPLVTIPQYTTGDNTTIHHWWQYHNTPLVTKPQYTTGDNTPLMTHQIVPLSCVDKSQSVCV